MNAGLACCAAASVTCCPVPGTSLPSFTMGGASAWPGAVAFGLLVTGALLTGYFVLVEVARALAIVTAS